MWFDVAKGRRIEDELEITNSAKSWNESETTDLVQWLDLEESNLLKAERTRTQQKSIPIRRNQRVDKR